MNKFYPSLIYRFMNQNGGRKHYLFNLVNRTSDQATFHLRDKGNQDLIQAQIDVDYFIDIPTETAKFTYKGIDFKLRADFYISKGYPISEDEKAIKFRDQQLDHLSASEIVKKALEELAPQSATTVVNSDSMPISLSMNLIDGIKLNLSLTLTYKLEGIKQFASSLASYVTALIKFFSNIFVSNSKEFGVVSISGSENDLLMSVKLNSATTKGGNIVDMKSKDVKVSKFFHSLPVLKKIIKEFDSRDGMTTNICISYYDSDKHYIEIVESRNEKKMDVCISYYNDGRITRPLCFRRKRSSVTISRYI